MRNFLFLLAAGCLALFARIPPPLDRSLDLINRLDEWIQRRFQDPLPNELGMSRIVVPSSFGTHFRPGVISQRDFVPQNPAEQAVIQSSKTTDSRSACTSSARPSSIPRRRS